MSAKKHPLREATSQLLENGVHAIELMLAALVLITATAMGGHVVLLIWHASLHFTTNFSAIKIQSIVVEAMDILILLELANVFIRLEAKQNVGIGLLLDTATLFSVRETLLGLYSHDTTLWTAETAVALFVGLRIVYTMTKPRSKNRPPEAIPTAD